MPLTEKQVDFLQRLIVQIETSPNREGVITIEIKNGHVRRVYAAPALYMPKPDYKDAKGVIPWKEGDELPEDVVRRLRGGV